MSCHVRGLIPKADQVRAHVDKNAKAFAKADRERIQALYAPKAKMQARWMKTSSAHASASPK